MGVLEDRIHGAGREDTREEGADCAAGGVDTEGVFARAVAGRWNDVAIRIIGLDDLIVNKEAAGRPQDLADARLLRRVRERSR